MVLRQGELDFSFVRKPHETAGQVHFVIFHLRAPYFQSLGLQERVGHRAADEHGVRRVYQPLEKLDLVGDFGAADDGRVRALRILNGLAQVFELLLHQQSGHRRREVVRDALGRGVRAMRRAKRIVRVEVAQGRKPARELGVVPLFLGVEPQVFEQQNVAVLERCRLLLNFAADAIGRERNALAHKL